MDFFQEGETNDVADSQLPVFLTLVHIDVLGGDGGKVTKLFLEEFWVV